MWKSYIIFTMCIKGLSRRKFSAMFLVLIVLIKGIPINLGCLQALKMQLDTVLVCFQILLHLWYIRVLKAKSDQAVSIVLAGFMYITTKNMNQVTQLEYNRIRVIIGTGNKYTFVNLKQNPDTHLWIIELTWDVFIFKYPLL